MIPLGLVAGWVAYAVGSYGYVLIKGWNITPRQWFSPLHPYTWPAGKADPPPIPASQIWPAAAAGAGGGAGGSVASAAAPNPIATSAGEGSNQTPAGGGLPVQH